jgi:hypothetical protein
MTKDVVKVPHKKPKEESDGTGPQDLDYGRLLLVWYCPRCYGPVEKVSLANKGPYHERRKYALMIHRVPIHIAVDRAISRSACTRKSDTH